MFNNNEQRNNSRFFKNQKYYKNIKNYLIILDNAKNNNMAKELIRKISNKYLILNLFINLK